VWVATLLILLFIYCLFVFFDFQPNCLILAITPANQDVATSDAIKVSRQVDPAGMLAAFCSQSCLNYTDSMHLFSYNIVVFLDYAFKIFSA
jgi:hypothetical protein